MLKIFIQCIIFIRLHLNQGSGAWCPLNAEPETSGHYEYLQVDLLNLTAVLALSIQGRWDNMYGNEYTRTFRLELSRDGGKTWIRYKKMDEEEVRPSL